MKIIDRLPFADRPHLVTVGGEAVDWTEDNRREQTPAHDRWGSAQVTLKTKNWS